MYEITLRLASRINVVDSGGRSARSAVSVAQPSSNGAASLPSNRFGGLTVAPRPLRAPAWIVLSPTADTDTDTGTDTGTGGIVNRALTGNGLAARGTIGGTSSS